MDVQEVTTNKNVQLVGAVIVGFGTGLVTGYFLGKKLKPIVIPAETTVHNTFVDTSNDLTSADIFDAGRIRDAEKEVALAAVAEIVEPYSGISPTHEAEMHQIFENRPGEVVVEEEVEVETSVTATVHNVFENVSTDEWDYEAELAQRKDDEPFIIHQDEYFADEQGYEKKTYHYYVGDNILTDIVDTPVYQHEKLVGELKFGHGSTDKNVCYVRNPALEMDMEVLRNEGSYEQEVLGIIPEPDESRTPRKFRDD